MDSTISIGSYVQIKHQTSIGQVVRISVNNKVLIAVGSFHFYLPLHAVEIVKSPQFIENKVPKKTKFNMVLSSSREIDPVLDLHGFNKSEALLALEKFLDRSLLLGHSRLKIIHGQGIGVLGSAIRSYLDEHPLVKKVIRKSPIHCMAGMTIVEI